jgi:hypothetical protein
VELSDETSELQSHLQAQSNDRDSDSLFDWLLKRAEADLGVLHLLSIREAQRADETKQLEVTLVNQIDKLREICQTYNAELSELKVKLIECAERIDVTHAGQENVTTLLTNELSTVKEDLRAWQMELQARSSGIDSIQKSLASRTQTLQRQLHENIAELQATRQELCHFKSEHQSLLERITQAESITWQTRTLALSNAQQLQQHNNHLTNDIIALNVVVNELKDRASEAITFREPLLAEVMQNILPQIDTIKQRLDHEDDAHHQRDEQLNRLDSITTMLAERIQKSESLSCETLALVKSYGDSNVDWREQITKNLADLRSQITDASNGEHRNKESEVMLLTQFEQFEHHAAQKLDLQEQRIVNLEQVIHQLSNTNVTETAHQQRLTADRLYVLERGYEELLNTTAQIRSLEDRAFRSESDGRLVQSQTNATLTKLDTLENDLNKRFGTLEMKLSNLSESYNFVRPAEEIREIEQHINARFDLLYRELAVEREGLNHWANGLGTSFAAELSAIQTRISERQTQIEHNYDRLERWEEVVNAQIEGLNAQLQHTVLTKEPKPCDTVLSELNTLQKRTTDLESQTRRADDLIIAARHNIEESVAVIKSKLTAIENRLEQYSLPSLESITRAFKDECERTLYQVQEQAARQAELLDQRDSARAQQSEHVVQTLTHELELLKTVIDQKQDARSLPHIISAGIEDSIPNRLIDFEKTLQETLASTEHRALERSIQLQALIETLRAETEAIKTNAHEHSIVCSDSPIIRDLEHSLAARIQECQQQLNQQMTALNNCQTKITQQSEQAIDSLRTELATLNATNIDRATVLSLVDPALRSLEQRLSAILEGLRQDMEQEISRANRRDLELAELNHKCESLMQSAATFGVSVQSHNSISASNTSLMTDPLEPETSNISLLQGANYHSAREMQVSGDKEQLTKLQERMSSEIERARAQLKEKSGRWKVRNSGS